MNSRFIFILLVTITISSCVKPAYRADGNVDLVTEGLQGVDKLQLDLTKKVTEDYPIQDTDKSIKSQKIIQGNHEFVSQKQKSIKPINTDAGNLVSFNFTKQPIEAVINTILGDLLGYDYSIAQNVSGEVSFSTSKPIQKSEALSVLETLLSWTNNYLIHKNNRYIVVPSNQAIKGQLVPSLNASTPGSGLAARIFILKYISAQEMKKLLDPFAHEGAFLTTDASRNILIMAGTSDELDNYQQTIDTFDLNWLEGMSIGVFTLQRADVNELISELNQMFGVKSSTPLAGMLRFLPIERTNTIVAITSQPEYLTEVGKWIEIIDQGGNEPQMYVSDIRNMKATDLARYLRQIYGGETSDNATDGAVAPGLRTITLSSGIANNGYNNTNNGMTGFTNSSSNLSNDMSSFPNNSPASHDANRLSEDNIYGRSGSLDSSVRITAQKSSNQLIIRCHPSQWKEIQSAIKRLDNPPLQVQIETRILEVSLTGSLDLGVQWYLGHLAGNSTTTGIENIRGSQGALGLGGAAINTNDALYYSFVSNNLQVALHALETSGNTKVLSAPSLVVLNNQQARIQVGNNIPINQTAINLDNTLITTSSVQYIQTGVILDVTPRINPGGLVYMDIQQQVSDASTILDINGNPNISTRAISTQIAVQSNQTVLLGGLIQQNDAESDNSVPVLGRIPGLNWLFGNTSRARGRSELIVLITPKVITSDTSAKQVANEYREKLKLIKPL